MLIGLQASGKTTFYRQVLAATHAHVSKDAFPNARRPQRRQLSLIDEALAARRNVAVDNTNPSAEEWRPIIDAARSYRLRQPRLIDGFDALFVVRFAGAGFAVSPLIEQE